MMTSIGQGRTNLSKQKPRWKERKERNPMKPKKRAYKIRLNVEGIVVVAYREEKELDYVPGWKRNKKKRNPLLWRTGKGENKNGGERK